MLNGKLMLSGGTEKNGASETSDGKCVRFGKREILMHFGLEPLYGHMKGNLD